MPPQPYKTPHLRAVYVACAPPPPLPSEQLDCQDPGPLACAASPNRPVSCTGGLRTQAAGHRGGASLLAPYLSREGLYLHHATGMYSTWHAPFTHTLNICRHIASLERPRDKARTPHVASSVAEKGARARRVAAPRRWTSLTRRPRESSIQLVPRRLNNIV